MVTQPKGPFTLRRARGRSPRKVKITDCITAQRCNTEYATCTVRTRESELGQSSVHATAESLLLDAGFVKSLPVWLSCYR